MDTTDNEAYEVFFRRSPKPMYVFDVQNLGIVDVNAAALAMYGYEREAFMRMTALDIRPPSEVAEFLACLKTNDPTHRLWRHLRSDGSEMIVEVDWRRHEIDGRPCDVVVVTDVTERERSAATVALSEERFRNSVDLLLDGFILYSPVRDQTGGIVDLRFEYVNDVAAQALARSKDELFGTTLLATFRGPRSEAAVERYAHVIQTGRRVEFEAERHVDGLRGERLFNIRAARVGDRLGVAFRDVTERQRAERVLRESEERFRTVFEASPIGIALLDPSLRFLDVNPALSTFLDRAPEHLRSMVLSDVWHSEDAATERRLNESLSDAAGSYRAEHRFVKANGTTVWAILTAAALRDERADTIAVLAMIQDITVEKRQQAEIRRRADEARVALTALTPREREILEMASSRSGNTRDIARALHISTRTAESHLASVYRKLNVRSRSAAVGRYTQLVDAESAADR